MASFGVVVEITPIKINPWSFILKWIGSKLNGDIKSKLNEIETRIDENEVARIRWEILDFANSLHCGDVHTRDQFHHIVNQYTKYHTLIEKRGIENGVLDMEYEYIEKTYKKLLEKGTFKINGG